jgi:hypothetical protein
MPAKQVALDVAAFLDSPQAAELHRPSAADVRRVVEAFVSICYDELGKVPKLLDGEDVHVALGHLLPGRLKRKDPVAEHAPAILGAYLDHLEATQVVPQSFEMRRAFEATIGEFQETVRTGRAIHHHVPRQQPVVHKAEKLGRNDPCSCGSGKKFKKCHGA